MSGVRERVAADLRLLLGEAITETAHSTLEAIEGNCKPRVSEILVDYYAKADEYARALFEGDEEPVGTVHHGSVDTVRYLDWLNNLVDWPFLIEFDPKGDYLYEHKGASKSRATLVVGSHVTRPAPTQEVERLKEAAALSFLRRAIKPFAALACDPPCDFEEECHNCRARRALDGEG